MEKKTDFKERNLLKFLLEILWSLIKNKGTSREEGDVKSSFNDYFYSVDWWCHRCHLMNDIEDDYTKYLINRGTFNTWFLEISNKSV